MSTCSRGSAVGIATGYRLDDRGVGVRVPVGSRMFFSPSHQDRLWRPPNPLSSGYRGVKRAGPETNHSHSSSADSCKSGSIQPLLHTPQLAEHRDNRLSFLPTGARVHIHTRPLPVCTAHLQKYTVGSSGYAVSDARIPE
jgi:hypothetical protein